MTEESLAPVDYRPDDVGRIPWLLKQAERETARELDRVLRDTPITKSQFGVLNALVVLKRASSAALARTVFVTPQAMVGMISALEKKGLIKRKVSEASARVIEATPTAEGIEVHRKAVERLRYVDEEIEAGFTPEEHEKLQEYLTVIIEVMQHRERSSATSTG